MNQSWIRVLPSFIRTRLEGRHNLQKILSNIGWLFADRILRVGMGLFVGVWVARYLGPEQFGLYNFAIAFVTLFSAFATLGLDSIVVRDIVRDPSCKDETLGTAFALKLIGGVIIFLLTTEVIPLLRPGDNLTRWMVGIIAAGTIFQAFDAIDFWFQSQVQSKYTVYAKNAAFLLVAVIKITLIQVQAPLIAFAWAGLGEIALGAIGLVVSYQANGQHFQVWSGGLLRAKGLLKDSWPLILSSLAIGIYMKIDQVMLGQMAGDKAVGVYSAATRISELWYFIPTAIVASVFPSIVEVRKISETLYYQRLQRLFTLMVRLAFAIAIPITLLSEMLVTFLFGKSYAAAGPILAIHIWAALFVFLGVAQSLWDVTESQMILSLQRTVMGAVINVFLNLILIPLYSGIGAAIATLVAYAFAAFILNVVYAPTRRIFFFQAKSIFSLTWVIR